MGSNLRLSPFQVPTTRSKAPFKLQIKRNKKPANDPKVNTHVSIFHATQVQSSIAVSFPLVDFYATVQVIYNKLNYRICTTSCRSPSG